jgi:hypothetical protein
MTIPYNPTPIDFSALAGIGQGLGGALGQHNLGTAMRDSGAIGPDGTLDYNKMVAVLAERRPELAAKMAAAQQDAANRYGHNLVFDANGNAYQTMSGGGLSPVSGAGGTPMVAPQTWIDTPNGRVPVSSRGPVGPGGHTVQSVPTVDVNPDGTTTPTRAIPSIASEKHRVDRAETKATDRALATNTIDKLNEQIYAFKSLVDEQGKSTPGLQKITGNKKIGNFDTTIPNDWLPDYSQEARNASASMATSAIQVGLNTLEQMRAMSAQGASGMGQLAIQESVWLQNSIASLSKAQSPEQAAKHIQDIINRSKRVETIIRSKYSELYGEELPNSGPTMDQPPQGNVAPSGAGGDDPLGLF